LARGEALAKARRLEKASEATKVIGSIFILAGMAFLIFRFYRNLDRVGAAQSLEELGGVLYDMLIAPLLVILTGVVLQELSATLRKRARRLEEEFRNELLGLIEVYGRISLNDLAAKVNMSPREVESLLARLAREGAFKGVISEDGYVYYSREALVPAPVVSPATVAGEDVERGGGGTVVVEPAMAETVPGAPSQEPPSEDKAPGGEQEELPEDVRRELEELERAYREGLISREAYEKARRELESRSGRLQ